MEYLLAGVFLFWLVSREMKETCSICHCKRKMKHLRQGWLVPYVCDPGCLTVAFITGKVVCVNGEVEVIYNWEGGHDPSAR